MDRPRPQRQPSRHSKKIKGSGNKRRNHAASVPSPMVQQMVEMGFQRSRVEFALKELGEDSEDPRAELIVAWLLDHPDVEVSCDAYLIFPYQFSKFVKSKNDKIYDILSLELLENFHVTESKQQQQRKQLIIREIKIILSFILKTLTSS